MSTKKGGGQTGGGFGLVPLRKEGAAMHPDDINCIDYDWTPEAYERQLEAYYRDNPGERKRMEGDTWR